MNVGIRRKIDWGSHSLSLMLKQVMQEFVIWHQHCNWNQYFAQPDAIFVELLLDISSKFLLPLHGCGGDLLTSSCRKIRWNVVEAVVLHHHTQEYYAHSKSHPSPKNWARLGKKASKVITPFNNPLVKAALFTYLHFLVGLFVLLLKQKHSETID